MIIGSVEAIEAGSRTVREKVIVDFDLDGGLLGIEIIGYSYVAGKPVERSDFDHLSKAGWRISFDPEADAVTIEVDYGDNAGQRSVDAFFCFSADGALIGLELPEFN
jgi:hypothetical protein